MWDEFANVFEALDPFPGVPVEERAGEEAHIELESGRTISDILELLGNLVDETRTIWENDRFASVPFPIIQDLYNRLNEVIQFLDQYSERQIPAQRLEKSTNQLHLLLWQNNLIGRMEELPGLERKHQQLESLKRKGRRIIQELEQGLADKETLEQLMAEAHSATGTAADLVTEIRTAVEQSQSNLSEATNNLETTKQSATESQTLEQQVISALERVKESENEIGALREKIKLFFKSIDKYENQLVALEENAGTALLEREEKTEQLITRNEELEKQVLDQLQKATGASLFSAFHRRRERVTTAKWVWASLCVLGLGFTVYWGVFLASAASDLDAAFLVKLGGTVPLVVLLVFFIRQYGRERRIEEEYAFKSVLSLSLVPYKELVEGLEIDEHNTEYAKFLINTIGKIYESPRIGSDRDIDEDEIPSGRSLRQMGKFVEQILKAAGG